MYAKHFKYTFDLTAQWTENVSKYKIEQLSVYLTWQHFNIL